MRNVLITILLCQNSFLIQAQSSIKSQNDPLEDSVIAHGYYEKGDSLYQAGSFDEAGLFYKKSASLFGQSRLWEDYFKSRIRLYSTYRKQHKLDLAISSCKELKDEIIEKLGPQTLMESKVYELIGNCYNIKSEYHVALDYLLKTLAIRKKNKGQPLSNLADIYSNLAISYFRLGNFQSSLENFLETLKLRKQEYGSDHLLVADAYHNIGFFYYAVQEIDLSLEYYNNSLTIYKALYDEDHYELGNVYNGIGLVLKSKGNFSDAAFYFDKAYNIGFNSFGENHYLVVDALMNKAVLNFDQGNYETSLAYNLRTLNINRRKYGENHLATADIYWNIGEDYKKLGKADLALKNLNASKKIHYEIHGRKNPQVANIHNAIGFYYINQNNLDSALFHFQKGLVANVVDFDNMDVHSNPSPKDCFDQNLLLKSLYYKGHLLFKTYQKESTSEYLKSSKTTFELCDNTIDQIRQSQLLNTDKINQGKLFSSVYQDALRTSLELYSTEEKFQYFSSAFYFSEKNKGAVLKESISSLKLQHYGAVPDSLIKKEHKFINEISYYQSKLSYSRKSKNMDSTAVAQLEAKFIDLNESHRQLTEKFKNQYPNYYNLKGSNQIASPSQVREFLPDNTTLLEYFVGDSAIYAFIINNDAYDVKKFSLSDSLIEDVMNLPIVLRNEDLDRYGQIANRLYIELIEPLQLETENLIIVPDDILWYLNFDILLTANPVQNDFRSLDYLIKKHNISYAYSATLLLQDFEFNRTKSKENNCLAFSYGSPSDTIKGDFLAMRSFRNEDRQSLPGTQKEVNAIAGLLEGDYYFGSFANERNFKENAKNYSVLHLALHGEIDDANPMNSKLIFSQSKDSIEDNYLHAFELYNTELNADLAVLSACNTGSGKIQKGEGIMSLGRAFSYAGCKSLLLSQWALSDVTTPEIIKAFYKNLQNGQSKSGALRNAKLSYLENADQPSANPYYWASLIQLGNDEPIYSNNKKWWIMVSALLVLAIILFLLTRRTGRAI